MRPEDEVENASKLPGESSVVGENKDNGNAASIKLSSYEEWLVKKMKQAKEIKQKEVDSL